MEKFDLIWEIILLKTHGFLTFPKSLRNDARFSPMAMWWSWWSDFNKNINLGSSWNNGTVLQTFKTPKINNWYLCSNPMFMFFFFTNSPSQKVLPSPNQWPHQEASHLWPPHPPPPRRGPCSRRPACGGPCRRAGRLRRRRRRRKSPWDSPKVARRWGRGQIFDGFFHDFGWLLGVFGGCFGFISDVFVEIRGTGMYQIQLIWIDMVLPSSVTHQVGRFCPGLGKGPLLGWLLWASHGATKATGDFPGEEGTERPGFEQRHFREHIYLLYTVSAFLWFFSNFYIVYHIIWNVSFQVLYLYSLEIMFFDPKTCQELLLEGSLASKGGPFLNGPLHSMKVGWKTTLWKEGPNGLSSFFGLYKDCKSCVTGGDFGVTTPTF